MERPGKDALGIPAERAACRAHPDGAGSAGRVEHHVYFDPHPHHRWGDNRNSVRKSETGRIFLFEKYYFIPADSEIDEIEISAYGYAGVGITWIEADTDKGHFVPEKLVSSTGLVEDPQYLLIQDVKFAFFGTRDVFSQFVDRAKGLARHTVVIKMKKES